MTAINLLPWRELKREKDKKQFSTMLMVGAFIAIFVVVILNYYANILLDRQQALNQRLTDEVNLFNNEIKQISSLKTLRSALISRMNIVQNLQATRLLTVHLLDELVHILPDGVYLTKVERLGASVNLYGYADSNTNISSLMRNIEANQWVQNPELTEIKKSDGETLRSNNEFKLSFILKSATLLGGSS